MKILEWASVDLPLIWAVAAASVLVWRSITQRVQQIHTSFNERVAKDEAMLRRLEEVVKVLEAVVAKLKE